MSNFKESQYLFESYPNEIAMNSFKFMGFQIVLLLNDLSIIICPVTENNLKAEGFKLNTIECLRSALSKYTKISQKNFTLLYRDRQLTSKDDLPEGSQITLVPYDFSIVIFPVIGNNLEAKVRNTDTIERLKNAISIYLQIPKENFVLSFSDTQLKKGSLKENGITKGCRITLLPSARTGLLGRKHEYSALRQLQNDKEKETNSFLNETESLQFLVRFRGYETKFQVNLTEAELGNFSRDKNCVRSVEQYQGEDLSPYESGLETKSSKWEINNTNFEDLVQHLIQTAKQVSSDDCSEQGKSRIYINVAFKPKVNLTDPLRSTRKDLVKYVKIYASRIISSLNKLLSIRPEHKRIKGKGKLQIEDISNQTENALKQNEITRKTLERLRVAMKKGRIKRNKMTNITKPR
jgi:hypothetical protein